MVVKKIVALLVLVFLFAWLAHKTGAATFVQGLFAVYGHMIVLAVFDTCFLDGILFANIADAACVCSGRCGKCFFDDMDLAVRGILQEVNCCIPWLTKSEKETCI